MGHGDRDKRISMGTTATFGMWDRGLQSDMDQNGSMPAVTEFDPVGCRIFKES